MLETVPDVLIGADILEIVGVAMYAEPLVVYRELIQNSADAIERAIRAGLLDARDGAISIAFDRTTRTVLVRDNGYGLPNEEFDEQMLALGASAKRNGGYRGFRGIGRLSALGHCRKLTFRSRGVGDRHVKEASWDGEFLRAAMLGKESIPLAEVTRNAVHIHSQPATDEPGHFFEVRLQGMRRLPDDRLFEAVKVAKYLSQVAPVAFNPAFSFGEHITREVARRTPLLELSLSVDGRHVFKPYVDNIEVGKAHASGITEIQIIEVPSDNGRSAALGWIAHTEYLGVLSPSSALRGLRVRSGNIQVGDEDILARAFPEERFNAWSVGEFHVFDSRLRPNARRDAFEPSIALDDLFNRLAPYGTAIAKRCRLESQKRRVMRRLEDISTMLGELEKARRRDPGPLANAVREYVGQALLKQLNDLRPTSAHLPRDRFLAQVEKLAKRIDRAAGPRGTKVPRLGHRDLGRLDVLKWLYGAGEGDLVAQITASLNTLKRR